MTDDTTSVTIDAGTLEFSAEDLTATGLLIPFGVPARSNLGTFTFSAGDVILPEDLTGMSLNVEHKREDVVGGFSKVWEQPEGVMATFKYRNTAAGRQAFEDGKSGKRKNLSSEVANVRIQGGKALPGAELFAAAQVERPAFEGATLLAAEDTSTPLDSTLGPDEDGHLSVLSTALPVDITVSTPEGEQATYTPETTEATPAEANQNGGSTLTATEVIAGAPAPAPAPAAVVPTTLLASTPAPEPEVDMGAIFASIAQIKSGMKNPDAETLLAALADIKINASGGLTTAANGVIQPGWVGRLWQGKRYNRKYLDLLTHTYGPINYGGRKGFKLAQGTALVAKWGGNKTELPTGSGTTSSAGSTVQPYGWAADVAREWFDLEGGADVIQALFEGVVDSYAQVTDEDALKTVFDVASKTSTALDRLVAPGTFPSQYSPAMGMVIDAIEAVSDANDDPSFVVVNPVAWRQLILTPKDLVPEYVSFSARAGSGEGSADKVIVKKAPQSFFPGTVAANPQVLAGAKAAIEFRELGTTPIQIDALDIAKGGVDKAVIGYLETFVVRPESLVLVGTKP